MYRPRTAVIPGLGTVTPNGDVSATDWLPVQEEAHLSMTRTYDTRAFGNDLNAAVNQCHADGGGTVFVGAPITPGQDIILKDKVYLTGRGIGATVLNARSITGTGSYSALPNLAATASANTRTLTFSAAPDVAPGDVIIIYNPTDYSFNNAPGRPYYRNGEFARVLSVSGTTVTLTRPLYATHPTSVQVSKLNPIRTGISNMSIVGQAGVTLAKISYGQDLVFRDLDLKGSNISMLTLDRCYNVNVTHVSAFDANSIGSTNYGITLANCQRVRLNSVDLETYRHGFTVGGDSAVNSIPVRDIIVADSYIAGLSSAVGVTGCNLHGNAEYVRFDNVTMPAGVTIAGDHITVRSCHIGTPPWGTAIQFTEMLGCNVTIEGNVITPTDNHDTNRGLVYAQFTSGFQRNSGTLRIVDNFINFGAIESTNSGTTVGIYVLVNTGPISVTGHELEIRDNRIKTVRTITSTRYGVRIHTMADAPDWAKIDIQDNTGNMHIVQTLGTTKMFFVGEGTDVPTFVANPGSMYRRLRTTTAAATALYVNRDGSSTWRAIDV